MPRSLLFADHSCYAGGGFGSRMEFRGIARIGLTGVIYRGETGDGRHAEFCALKKLNDDVDNVDLSGCTVFTTLEPCSERNPPKLSCASRLIKAKAARVVSGMPDKDKNVYGLSSLAEAKVHIGLFPND